jgi:hypothetical protein
MSTQDRDANAQKAARSETMPPRPLLAGSILVASLFATMSIGLAQTKAVEGEGSRDLSSEKEDFFDDRAIVLATIAQSNGNLIEFLSNPEFEELTLWESGPADAAGPVFADDGEELSMLEAYLRLVPLDFPVPDHLVRYSRLDPDEVQRLLAGRSLVASLPQLIEIGDHLQAPPAVSQSICYSIGSDNYAWGPEYRESGCNADGRAGFVKARICNKSNWGSIRMALGYKHFSWSDHFVYPNSKSKYVGGGDYAYVVVNSIERNRRALYTAWDAGYESAWVGGWFERGSMTANNCGGGHLPI